MLKENASYPWTMDMDYLEDKKLYELIDRRIQMESQRKEDENMNFNFGNMFDGMFKPVANGYCKIGMNGKIAIKTNSGYKTFDLEHKKLVNCDSFAFDMDGAFWVVPTFKLEKGDIILVNGAPQCVIEVNA